MAVTMADITKLRNLTSAGLMDCKKALAETDGDIEKAVEILRKKGQAVAAKREDREASEGCVLAKCDGDFAAVVALKCETDFVGKNEGFVNLTKSILDAAMAAKAKSLDEVKELEINGQKIADLIVEQTGKTGEKIELGAYEYVEAPATIAYNHFGNKLATLVAFSKAGINEQVYKNVAMQVAAMNPIAVDECDVPEETKEKEIAVAIEKTKAEQVQKAVEAALKKAGINPAHVDSEDHMESNKAKGWITEEDVAKAKEIIATVSAEKAANLPEAMIQNIAKGRLGKFLKEVCLLNQEDVVAGDKKSVRETLKAVDADLKVLSFKRINLNVD
ncbi:MAG: elongation factor Ts [Muribaculaceae bacterium]|nr:elongation factor Ts [Muribaculaceae bacterium]MBQ7851819.1 elongation factor Ts [Muribaculaceae bacterium]MBR1963405.1 elongation factor Ts [Muribaculaceae bacterium]